jgi:hypothetical protein
MPNYAACPPGAPPGSKWTIVAGRFQCLGPNGQIVPGNAADPTGRKTPTPIFGSGQPSFGIGGPSPGGTGSPYTSVPSGYPGQPGNSFPGGGNAGSLGGGGGAGNLGWKATLIPVAAGLLGQVFNYFGKKKTNDAQNANNEAANQQNRADTEARAHAAATIYSKMLGFYGHGDLANEDQLYNALLKEPSPTVKIAGPSAFTGLSGVADSVAAGAQDYYYRQNQTQQQQQQADVWKQIMDLIMKSQTQTPVQGGTSPYGGMD